MAGGKKKPPRALIAALGAVRRRTETPPRVVWPVAFVVAAAIPVTAIAAAVSLAVAGGPVLADDTSAGRDIDGVYPVSCSDVEMAAENVTIELFRPEGDTAALPGLYSRVRCEFTFHSLSSAAREVLMAFPAEPAPSPDETAEGTDGLLVRDFAAYLEGPDGEIQLPVSLEPASATGAAATGAAPTGAAASVGAVSDQAAAWASWYTFKVAFAPGETRTVVNTYWVKNTLSSNGEAWVKYVLETGRNWAGPIGEATVTLKLGDVLPAYIDNLYPGDWRFTPDGGSLVWHRTAFEPAYNLVVRYNLRAWDGHNDTRPERRAELDKLFAAGPGLSRARLLEEFQAALAADDIVKAAAVRAFLPDEAVPEGRPELTGVTITRADEATAPLLSVAYADAAGDITALRLKVSHEENGRAVTDYETTETFTWTCQAKSRGTYEVYLGDQPAYRVEAVLEDAGGRTASFDRVVPVVTGQPSETAPGSGGGPDAGQGAADATVAVAATVAVLGAVTGVLLVRRAGRRARGPARG